MDTPSHTFCFPVKELENDLLKLIPFDVRHVSHSINLINAFGSAGITTQRGLYRRCQTSSRGVCIPPMGTVPNGLRIATHVSGCTYQSRFRDIPIRSDGQENELPTDLGRHDRVFELVSNQPVHRTWAYHNITCLPTHICYNQCDRAAAAPRSGPSRFGRAWLAKSSVASKC